MFRKCLKKLSGLSAIAGFMLVIGTAGASDLDMIDFKSIILKIGLALALIAIGCLGLWVNNWEYVND